MIPDSFGVDTSRASPVFCHRFQERDTVGGTLIARRHKHHAAALLLLCLAAGTITVCGGVETEQQSLATLTDQGKFVEAHVRTHDPDVEKTYGEKNYLLLRLERGSAALAAQNCDQTITALNEAEGASAYNYDLSTWDRTLQYAVNDSASAYYARPHEDIYVNVLKQIAYLHQGVLENGAIVESNRQLDKATWLRAQHSQLVEQLRQKDSAKVIESGESQLQINKEHAGEFIDSPLGAYLGALSFANYGLYDKQQVAANNLRTALAAAPTGPDPVQADKFTGLDSESVTQFNTVVIALSGRSPSIVSKTVSIPILKQSVSGAIPELQMHASPIHAAALEVRDGPTVDLDLIEDMSAVIAENFRRQEESIYYRAMIRLGIKVGVVTAASLGVQASTDNELYTGMTALFGAAYIWATETADKRAWTTLPGQARVKALSLPTGAHEARIVYTGDNGTRWEGPWMTIESPAKGLRAIVDRCPQ